MKHIWLAGCLIGASVHAGTTGRLAAIDIIDRDTGATLPTYRYRGDYWIAGRPGGRYSISIRNTADGRLLAVTTVDGINVISGEAGAWNQRGYVFGPGEGYDIDGWRKSDREIAAFEFTSASNSYAERTGRPANVGVIGVALFLERQRIDESAQAGNRADAAAPGAPANAPADTLASKLGTGHGAREYSYAQTTQFDRRSSVPDEVIRIRYDSFERLVAMGIVRRGPIKPYRGRPDPFPDSTVGQYVPDPPGGG